MIAFDNADTVKHIWIFQKGNGQVSVSPSPAVMKGGCSFSMVNRTNGEVTVTFPEGSIAPKTFTIRAGEAQDLTAPSVSAYVEYEVSLAAGGGRSFYAEGNSKPNIIIQP